MIEPFSEVAISNGAYSCLFGVINAVVNPGDEVRSSFFIIYLNLYIDVCQIKWLNLRHPMQVFKQMFKNKTLHLKSIHAICEDLLHKLNQRSKRNTLRIHLEP